MRVRGQEFWFVTGGCLFCYGRMRESLLKGFFIVKIR